MLPSIITIILVLAEEGNIVNMLNDKRVTVKELLKAVEFISSDNPIWKTREELARDLIELIKLQNSEYVNLNIWNAIRNCDKRRLFSFSDFNLSKACHYLIKSRGTMSELKELGYSTHHARELSEPWRGGKNKLISRLLKYGGCKYKSSDITQQVRSKYCQNYVENKDYKKIGYNEEYWSDNCVQYYLKVVNNRVICVKAENPNIEIDPPKEAIIMLEDKGYKIIKI